MKKLFYSLLAVVLAACGSEKQAPIDREALVARTTLGILVCSVAVVVSRQR